MKKLTLFCICLLPFCVFAQTTSETKAQHYLFENFETAVVKMTSGITEKALMNYNTVTEEMVFNQNDKMLALDHLERIDTIYLNEHIFVPVGKKFYDQVYNAPIPLYIQHKKTLSSAGKPAAYGGTTQTSAVTSITSLSSSGNIYKLKLPEEYITSDASLYWIPINNKWRSFLTGSQLKSILPEKKDDIKKFVKQKKTDFKKTEDVVALMKYLNGES